MEKESFFRELARASQPSHRFLRAANNSDRLAERLGFATVPALGGYWLYQKLMNPTPRMAPPPRYNTFPDRQVG
jgi:hypothetical protein